MLLKYQFPAVKGYQAGKEYYICMVPLGLLSKIFISDNGDVAPEYRAQRKLNESRIPEIRDYILNNRDSYVFSALAASIDGDVNFIPTHDGAQVGVLEVDMDASFLINDGQHRKAAIDAAITEDESLKSETISVVMYKDQGLKRSQQMFTDLNKHAVTTSKSLNTLYESKDRVAIITKNVVNSIDFLRKYTDKEKDNLSKFSSNLFTLNTFYTANKRIIKIIGDTDLSEQFIHDFWYYVVQNVREWNEMDKGELSKKSLREDYIVTQGLIILSIGRLGEFFCQNKNIDMQKSLVGLRTIDWLRNNEKLWMNRAIKANGKINRNEQGIFLTYIQIKKLLSLPITNSESQKERAAIG
jgi:DNA sulfur modification protein dndB